MEAKDFENLFEQTQTITICNCYSSLVVEMKLLGKVVE